MERSYKSIILEYVYYGYDPKEIAEIEGIKYKTVEACISKERIRIRYNRRKKKNYFEKLKISFSEDEMDYGSEIRMYHWCELSYREQELITTEEHEELRKGYLKEEN